MKRKIKIKFIKVVSILLILLVFLVSGVYFALIFLVPEDTAKAYSIDIGSDFDTDKDNPFHILEADSLSERVLSNNKNYRETLSDQPFYLFFNGSLTNLTNATIEVNLLNRVADLYMNEELIFPGINNYKLIKEFGDSYLYMRKNLSSVENSSTDIINYIMNNYYGARVFSFTFLDKAYSIPQDYSKKESRIESKFRGDVSFVIYNQDDLKLKFFKQDINSYPGKDEYLVTIRALDGGIVYEEILRDDGNVNVSQTLNNSQGFEINLPDVDGVNYIIFKNINADFLDSTISNISINTNKVVIQQNFLVISPISLYMKNHFDRNISFYYWHAGKDQTIKIINNNSTEEINLSKNYEDIRYNYVLKPGENEITINKSYLWVGNDFNFAVKKENWFEVPIIIQDELDDPEFIVLDKNKVRINRDGAIVRIPIMLNASEMNFSLRSTGVGKLKLDSVRIILRE